MCKNALDTAPKFFRAIIDRNNDRNGNGKLSRDSIDGFYIEFPKALGKGINKGINWCRWADGIRWLWARLDQSCQPADLFALPT